MKRRRYRKPYKPLSDFGTLCFKIICGVALLILVSQTEITKTKNGVISAVSNLADSAWQITRIFL